MPNLSLPPRIVIIYKKLLINIINKLLVLKIYIWENCWINKSIVLYNRQRNISNQNSSKQSRGFSFNSIKIHIFKHSHQINSFEVLSIDRQNNRFWVRYTLLNIISSIPFYTIFRILINIFVYKNRYQISSIERIFSKNTSKINKKPTL